jgi:hypothetical protein
VTIPDDEDYVELILYKEVLRPPSKSEHHKHVEGF